jgi:hypothetical protein
MHTTKATTPTLNELFNAQSNGHVLANNQGEEQRLLDRKRAAYALKVAEREYFLRFCEENTFFDVVLRGANGVELPLRPSFETISTIYGAIHEELQERLREQEQVIIGELLRMERDAAAGTNEQERVQNIYESAILALCTPAATSSAIPATEIPASTSLPALPAGQRLFISPPTRYAAPTV